MSEFKEWEDRQYSVDYAIAFDLPHPWKAYRIAIKFWESSPYNPNEDTDQLAKDFEALLPDFIKKDVAGGLFTTTLLVEIIQEEKAA